MKALVWRIASFTLIFGITLGSIGSAQAFSAAFFHTISKGNRGTDVKTMQYLLNISADGVFGSGTESSVKSFQSSRGLPP